MTPDLVCADLAKRSLDRNKAPFFTMLCQSAVPIQLKPLKEKTADVYLKPWFEKSFVTR